METIYLVRHGKPDFPDDIPRCIGVTDLSLSAEGERQAAETRRLLVDEPVGLCYASPLLRCRQTAAVLWDGEVELVPGLREVDAGEWDGLTFEEIRARDPELHTHRGLDPTIPTPGGEDIRDAAARAGASFRQLLVRARGDRIIVAHAGINRLLLCGMLGLDVSQWLRIPQPYCCVNVIRRDGDACTVDAVALDAGVPGAALPRRAHAPSPAECALLCERYETPPGAVGHCVTVAAFADELAGMLVSRGIPLDRRLVTAGALLHDIARIHPDHAAVGAGWLRQEGYPAVADIIERHMQLDDVRCIDETMVVYYADKRLSGKVRTTLDERFGRTEARIDSPGARAAFEARREQALLVEQLLCKTLGVDGLE